MKRGICGSLVSLGCLIAVVFFFSLSTQAQAPATGFKGVFTWRSDNLRTGQNTQETTLTPANVNSTTFGKVFSYPVTGQIYAQPLYVPSVNIPTKNGTFNVVYVVTEQDWVYAFDADGAHKYALWGVDLANPSASITPVPAANVCKGCNISPWMGITGTPVIDPTTGTMYLVARTYNSITGIYAAQLHALDITSGAEKFGGPVTITATQSGATFIAKQQGQRPGLLLLNKTIYIGFAGNAHGWILAYDSQTLALTAVLCTQPGFWANHPGGVWMSGAGLAADSTGHIYAVVGDGLFDANVGGKNYGDTMLKLGEHLNVVDYFTPDNQATIGAEDNDFGSGGVLLLPPQTGPYANEMIGGGKDGNLYVVNRDNLGQFNSTTNNVIQTVATTVVPAFASTPAYWNGNIYTGAVSDYLRMYTLTNGSLSLTSVSQSPTQYQFPGPTPSVSSNGTTAGIVWALERDDNNFDPPTVTTPAILHAYDATNLANELYNTTQAGTRDVLGHGIKFIPPTIANGRVYVGTEGELDVLGLLP